MDKCEMIKEIWDKLKTPEWCKGGLCGTRLCVRWPHADDYAKVAMEISEEVVKHGYGFLVEPGVKCVSVVYNEVLRNIDFEKFVVDMATTIYPSGECRKELSAKIDNLKSGIYCADELAKRLGIEFREVVGCMGMISKLRNVAIRAVGKTYFIVLGQRRILDSPLFR